MTHSQFESSYFAAIDLGSNSFHMLIARINGEKVEIVDREKQMVQIARGLNASGQLDEGAQERALSCLHQFSERLRDIPKAQIRAVGTKTLRAASNADAFLSAAENVLGAKIQIISGYEEARLVYKGLAHTISKSEKRLVIDIGGGSTEFIIGKGNEASHLESLALGCVSYSERYILHQGGVTKYNMLKAYYAACAELEDIRSNFLKEGWDVVYGTSGTMKAVAEVLAEKDGGVVISKDRLDRLIDELVANGGFHGSEVSKLRREVLPSGLAILQAIFDQLKISKIHVSRATLKEGLIYDTLGRISDHDSRELTVSNLMKQYAIDRGQAMRVRKVARYFWSQIKGPDLTGVSRTKMVTWSALLHEIGLNISHSGYHHHGYYILRHSDLAGFGRYEQYILANLVRLHRKKPQQSKTEGLDSCAWKAFVPILICLRLAVVLFRRREDIDPLPKFSEQSNGYTLSFDTKWLDDHPLTLAGLEQEQQYLENIGVTLNIETYD